MKHAARWMVAVLALAVAAGCGGRKTNEQAGPPVKPMEDSAYVEAQAQITILGKGFSKDDGTVDIENPDYKEALQNLLSLLGVSMRDVEAHGEALSKSGDSARIQNVSIAISERITELQITD